jgi:speckle-type POZ protein
MPTSSRVSADAHPSGSASSIVVDAERRYHLLKITDYSLTKLATNGEHINSSTFRVGGRTWRVRYYPNGCQSKNTDYISLFLALDDTAANTKAVKAQVHFSLLDQRGKPVPFYTGVAAPESLHLANSWGCDKFIKREALEKSEHLSNDCFTVKVDVVVVRGFHAQEMPSIVVPPSNMSWHFGDLLSSKAGCQICGRRGDVLGTPVGARCAVSGLQSTVLWPHEGEHRHKCHTDRRHGGTGVQSSAHVHVHGCAA